MFKHIISKRFECLACGKCCHTKRLGETVVLYEEDIDRIASSLNISIDEVVDKYTIVYQYDITYRDSSESVLLLVLSCEKRCIFLNGTLCSIHSFKPFQCRMSPFLNPFLTDVNAWSNFVISCPGINKGSKILISNLKRNFHEHRDREMQLFSQIRNPNSRMFSWIYSQTIARKYSIKFNMTQSEHSEISWNS